MKRAPAVYFGALSSLQCEVEVETEEAAVKEELSAEDYIQVLWPAVKAKAIEQFASSEPGKEFLQSSSTDEGDVLDTVASELDFVLQGILQGQTLAEMRGLSESHLNAIYSVAEARLASGSVEDAASLFQLLIMFDPTVAKFFTAFGACQQMLKKYDYAMQMYALAQLLDLTDPRIPQNAAMCCIYLGRLSEAKGMANRSLSICETALQDFEASARYGLDEEHELRRLAQKSQQLVKLIEIRERNTEGA